MRIINSPPFATSFITWQEQPGQWTLTLVCKATFSLVPGTAVVAAEPDGINDHDNHWDDDPQKSVYAPSDLVPYKPNPEVLLVGNAFAPRGEPVRSLFARLVVGQMDKSVEVFGQRTIAPDGSLVEGPRWAQMSLRYERAAGGEGSWNPVGVDPSATDPYGRRTLPNLQPPAFPDVDRGAPVPAIGFGPMAARWPARSDKLGPLSAAFLQGNWTETALGMDFDGSYFQAAPSDQFIDEIRADETIVLENLHKDVERLVTRLPGLRPRTRVEIDGLPPWELSLVADTLWIDTNRAICTVIFRGQLPLDGRDQPGTIYIGVEYPGEPVRFPDPPQRPHAASVPESPTDDDFDDMDNTHTNADALEGLDAVLPFKSSPSPALPWDPGATPPAPVRSASPMRPKRPEDFGATGIFPAVSVSGAMPTWLDKGAASKSRSAQAPRSTAPPPVAQQPLQGAPVAPPPPVAQMLRSNEVAPPSLAAASHRAAGIESVPAASRSAPPVAPPMSRPVPPIAPPMTMPIPPGAPPPPPMRSYAPTLPGIVAQPAPGAPAPPVAPVGTTFGQAAVLAAAKAHAAVPPSAPSSPSSPAPPALEKDRSRAGKPDPRMLATAAFLGAAEASNAAATTLPEEKDDKLPKDKVSASASGPTPGRMLVDILWYDPAVAPRLEENPAWKRILDVDPPEEKKNEDADGYLEPDLDKPQKKPVEPIEKTPEQKAKDEKSRVSKVLSRATPTIDVENALFSAVNDDGVLEPPLCVVAGEIELPFDEVETLRVLTSAAAPLATGDKKLKETVDLANEALGTPLGKSPEVAANFSVRVREAWMKANRMLPSDYLDVHSRRVLLEQRKYQMRELASAEWIRAVLHGVSGDKPIPTYLPADLSKKLPLFIKFSVRLIAEVLPQQDQNEAHAIALRVYALARTIPVRPRR
ncbi:MAG: DUF2169 domain-containing protein [Polyangiaceae bacterium]|nr:DUF2169 domain-containing protein [Polyangiaceae bacterium]